MSDPGSRRGFLRDLVRLPLIGGGLTLTGEPSAVATTITSDLLVNYETWLATEQRRLALELRPGQRPGSVSTFYTDAYNWHEPWDVTPLPSTRAALVLSAVGCGWGGYR